MYTISNLITGDLVLTANGKMATVMKNTTIGDILRFHTTKDSFSYLNKRYNDNLTHKTCKGLTIVKVYRVDPDKIESNKIGDLIANPDKMLEFGSVVFDRENDNSRNPVMAATAVGNSQEDKPTISDLLTGDMLVHVNGKVSTVYKDTPFGDITRYATEKNSFTYLYRFDNESLEHESNSEYDICAVFRANAADESTAGDAITNPAKMLVPENAVWLGEKNLVIDYFRDGEEQTIRIADYLDCDDASDDYDDEDF